MLSVEAITQADTFALRRSVLRDGHPEAVVAWDEDTWPGTVHLGVRVDGELVGTSTWIPRPMPETVDDAWQLRGMATANGRRGGGLGGILVEAGCQRCAGAGGRLVWARARDAALGFYVSHAFEVVGDGFVDATTGLPHHLVRRPVS
ncbi:MAG: GNAT family N-acetyltransferase [Ilumatobacteraceae bacterium]